MRSREHSATLVFSLAAFLFALLAGVFIPLTGGGARPAALNWTPPPTAIATATAGRTAPTSLPTATSVPTITLSPTQRVTKAATKPPTGTPPAVSSPSAARSKATPTVMPALQARARIAQGPLNLRTGPGTTYGVLATAQSGDEFAVMGRSEDGRWVQLCCVADSRAWAAAEFLALQADIESYPVMR